MTGDDREIYREKDNSLTDVAGRRDILIHAGNAVKDFSIAYGNQLLKYGCDSSGCILVGLGLSRVQDLNGEEQAHLTDSRKALTLLFNYVKSCGGFIHLLITSKRNHE